MCLAVPGRITEITGEGDLNRNARVDFSGITRDISLSLLPSAEVGDWVLVHAGFALNVIDEETADQTLADLRALGEAGGGLLDGDEFDRREAGLPAPDPTPGPENSDRPAGATGAGT